MNQDTANTNRNARTYTNTVLTVIAVLLAVLVVDNNDGLGPISTASAQRVRSAGQQQPTHGSGGLVSAADQRKTMIDSLNEMNGRLERIEKVLGKGVNVTVTSMPASARADEE